MRQLVVVTTAAMMAGACGESTPAKPVTVAPPPKDARVSPDEALESAPAQIASITPAPKPPLIACIEATGLTATPDSAADHMILKNKQGEPVVKVVLGEALADATMGDRVHKHRIGRYVFEFAGGKGDRTAIRTCIKENK
jgi:hypothetical protein